MRLFKLVLLLFVLIGCTVPLNESSEIEEPLSSAVTLDEKDMATEAMVTFEAAQQLFLIFHDDMEIVLAEFELNFEYINIDADSQGKLTCTFAQKGDINNTLNLDLEGLSEYIDQCKVIALLFDALSLSRMSYTSETINNAAIMSFVLTSQTQAIQGSDHMQQNECGIVHSMEPFGEYSYLDGDWFYYQSII